MATYAALDGDPGGGTQVATTTGWGDFGRWVETLDAARFGQTTHLAEYGWCQTLGRLESELAVALDESPPADADTRGVAAGLLAVVRGRGKATVLTAHNGLSARFGEGGDDDETQG